MRLGHVIRTLDVVQYTSPPAEHHRTRYIKPRVEEFELVTAGYGKLPTARGMTDVGPGSLLWYQAGDLIEIISDDREPYRCAVFKFIVAGRPKPRPPRRSLWTNVAEAVRFAETSVTQHRAGLVDDRWMCPYLYATLYWHAMQHTHGQLEPSKQTAIERAVWFIEQHFHKPIDVEAIAEAALLSASHLHAVMRQRLGKTPMQMVIARRLDEARRLLATSDMPIKHIQLQCGFRNATHFARTFRAATSISPTTYRLQHTEPGVDSG